MLEPARIVNSPGSTCHCHVLVPETQVVSVKREGQYPLLPGSERDAAERLELKNRARNGADLVADIDVNYLVAALAAAVGNVDLQLSRLTRTDVLASEARRPDFEDRVAETMAEGNRALRSPSR